MSVFLFVFFCLFPNSSNTAKPIELKLSQKIPFGRQMVLDKKIGLLFAKKKTQKNCLLARSSFPLFLFIREWKLIDVFDFKMKLPKIIVNFVVAQPLALITFWTSLWEKNLWIKIDIGTCFKVKHYFWNIHSKMHIQASFRIYLDMLADLCLAKIWYKDKHSEQLKEIWNQMSFWCYYCRFNPSRAFFMQV